MRQFLNNVCTMWTRAFTYDPDGTLQSNLNGKFLGHYHGGDHQIKVSLHRLNN